MLERINKHDIPLCVKESTWTPFVPETTTTGAEAQPREQSEILLCEFFKYALHKGQFFFVFSFSVAPQRIVIVIYTSLGRLTFLCRLYTLLLIYLPASNSSKSIMEAN